jgi:hypothetical protein
MIAEAAASPDEVVDGALELRDPVLEVIEAGIGVLTLGQRSKLDWGGGAATGRGFKR